jgi:predicted RNase H-like HicB family nuclease
VSDTTTLLASAFAGDRMVSMKKIIQVHIHKGEKYYVAECLDLPVVTQAETLDELADNLKEALALHLEDEDLSEFDLAPNPSILASFELEPLIHAKA